MTNWYSMFYWLTRVDSVKSFFDFASNFATAIAILSIIFYGVGILAKTICLSMNHIENQADEDGDADVRAFNFMRKAGLKTFYPAALFALIFWIGWALTPTKKDCLLIVAGGAVGNFVTRDSTISQLPADFTKYIHLSLQEEIAELTSADRKELNLETAKDKFMAKAKDMTKEEILKYVEADSSFFAKSQ